jgi:hypothetical protein
MKIFCMKPLTLVVFLLTVATAHGQTVVETVHLTPVKRLKHIHGLPFDKVVVFDNRYDSFKIAIGGDGIHPVDIHRLDSPAARAIQAYLETVVKGLPAGSGTLYVSVKQLRFQNVYSSTLFFSASAYLPWNGGYTKVAEIYRNYWGGSGFNHSPMKALDDLVREVAKNYATKRSADTKTYTIADINSNVTHDWMNTPFMKQDSWPVDGVYRTIGAVRNNRIEPTSLDMRMETDSAYVIHFATDAGWQKWAGHDNIFAVSYQGRLFVRITSKYFLPLYKVDQAFHFRVPMSLPNLNAILAAINLGVGDTPDYPLTNAPGALLGVMVTVILKNRANSVYNRTKQQIEGKGSGDVAWRSGVLDFDTGDLMY